MSDNPQMFVFAGPNGSGKSSTIKKLFNKIPSLYINADDIAREQGLSNLEAANLAEKLRMGAIEKRESFAMETVMSTPEKVAIMEQAKDKGFDVTFVFVCTQDSEINISRVEKRHLLGGHDVPEDKIRERYDRALELLPVAMEIADHSMILNNSFDSPVLIAEKHQDAEIELYAQEPPSKWDMKVLEDKILNPLRERQEAYQEITGRYPQAVRADTSLWTAYDGPMVAVNDYFAVQETVFGLVRHNKALCNMPIEQKTQETVKIAYLPRHLAIQEQKKTAHERVWQAVTSLDQKNYIRDSGLILAAETLIPLKFGDREPEAVYLLAAERGGYNQAKQLCKEFADKAQPIETTGNTFRFTISENGQSVRVCVKNEERIPWVIENYKGVPALSGESLLASCLLSEREKGSDQARNARNLVDLISIAGNTTPTEQKAAINAVNAFTVSKVRRIEEVIKMQDVEKALKLLDFDDKAAAGVKDRFAKLKGRDGLSL